MPSQSTKLGTFEHLRENLEQRVRNRPPATFSETPIWNILRFFVQHSSSGPNNWTVDDNEAVVEAS